MDYPKFIVSTQKEESIHMQRVKMYKFVVCILTLTRHINMLIFFHIGSQTMLLESFIRDSKDVSTVG